MGVGRRLQQAREARGLSLAQVASRTKISVGQLALLEAEDYGRLPHGIFIRGFLRATAGTIGLDPDEVVRQFNEEIGPATPALPPAEVPVESTAQHGPTVRLRIAPVPWAPSGAGGWMAAVVMVIATVLAVSWLRGAPDRPVALEPAASAAAPGVPPAVAQAQPVGTVGRGTPPAAVGVTLTLAADRPCWVSLTVDGDRVTHRTLTAGEQVTATMRQQASLRAGDAGALRVSANGARAQRIGADGEVRTIVLTPVNYPTVLSTTR
jgi:cytoskeletal protein RodZ